MKFLVPVITSAILALGGTTALAQKYPDKPVSVIVPFAPGGVTDVMARLVSTKLQEILGQPFIVVNKPGAGTLIASQFVSKAPGDGYTILMAASSFALGPSLYKQRAGYDPEKQFKVVSLLAAVPHVLVVSQQTSAGDVTTLIKQLKSSAVKNANYASSGNGASNHLEGELFARLSGLNLTHIPYAGSVPAMTALTSGDIGFMFVDLASAKPFIEGGRARVLAVTTKKRSELLPNVPTVEESGLKNFDATPWLGFVVPLSTPDGVIATLSAALQKVKSDPSVREKFAAMGLEADFSTPSEFRTFMVADRKKWETVIERAKISVD
jgi:tripartite-type tricarboxylate transporter receptor subunit TctC